MWIFVHIFINASVLCILFLQWFSSKWIRWNTTHYFPIQSKISTIISLLYFRKVNVVICTMVGSRVPNKDQSTIVQGTEQTHCKRQSMPERTCKLNRPKKKDARRMENNKGPGWWNYLVRVGQQVSIRNLPMYRPLFFQLDYIGPKHKRYSRRRTEPKLKADSFLCSQSQQDIDILYT